MAHTRNTPFHTVPKPQDRQRTARQYSDTWRTEDYERLTQPFTEGSREAYARD